MGHYDDSRPGYCAKCGAAPGNMKLGVCEFCVRTTQSQAMTSKSKTAKTTQLKAIPKANPVKRARYPTEARRPMLPTKKPVNSERFFCELKLLDVFAKPKTGYLCIKTGKSAYIVIEDQTMKGARVMKDRMKVNQLVEVIEPPKILIDTVQGMFMERQDKAA